MNVTTLIPRYERFEEYDHSVSRIGHIRSTKLFIHRLEDIPIDRTQPCLYVPPTRRSFYLIDLFVDTQFEHTCNGRTTSIRGSGIQFVHPNQIETISVPWSEVGQTKGFTLLFQPQFLSISIDSVRFYQEFMFFNPAEHSFLPLTNEQLGELRLLFEQINYEYHHDPVGNLPVIRSYLLIVLYKAKQWIAQQNAPQTPATADRATLLAREFEHRAYAPTGLLRTVEQVADEMAVSPQHLSETVKKLTGRTAKQILVQAQLSEARTLLGQPLQTVSEIAFALGYSEPSQFMHFFKRHTGQTPQ